MFNDYKGLLNQNYLIDKSNIINIFNNCIDKNDSKYVCITKPRRFGKTSIASMLVTYYSKGIDSKEIFDKLKVSKGISSDEKIKQLEIKQYNEYQGKYHTLFFDFSKDIYFYKHLNDYLAFINKKLEKDFKMLNPDLDLLKDYSNNIIYNLERFNDETNEKFILIIDEWDYIISNEKFSIKERNVYISFLCSLIKNKGYIAFVYMTGILPIAKELSQSTLNCFDEYSMLDDDMYYKYFGFTKEEVEKLCDKNNVLKYENLEKWYNGYKSYNGERIFNTWSVIKALRKNSIKNYWTETGRFDELKDIINFNIYGIKDDILELIKGKEVSITLDKYGAEDLQKEFEEKKKEKVDDEKEKEKKRNNEMKKKLYSKMVTYGFLTYCDGKISIPNEELKEKFIETLESDNDMKYYYNLIENSKKMLEMTLNKNTKVMCKILENSPMKKIKPGNKIDYGNLNHLIDFAYFNASKDYSINEEKGNGKGNVDYIFYPKGGKKEKGTVIILELKVNDSAEDAIKQIHERKYYYGLKDKGHKGNILLVGINYNKDNKQYTCIIEEYDCDLNLKSSNSENEKNNKSGIKRKNESDDSISSRLGSKKRKN